MNTYDKVAILILAADVFLWTTDRAYDVLKGPLPWFTNLPTDPVETTVWTAGGHHGIAMDFVTWGAAGALALLARKTSYPLLWYTVALILAAEPLYRVFTGEWGFGLGGQ